MEQALSISTPEAYNPFSGGGDFDKYLLTGQDGTPSIDGAVQNAIIDVYRKGKRKLNSIDFRFSNVDFIKSPGGFTSLALGTEYREDSFEDDRDPRLDGTIQYTDRDGDTFPFVSDVMNSSPTPDNSGKRDVFSAFVELGIPLISNEMRVPFIKNFDLQLAARYEDFSDIGSKSVPKISFGWQVDDSIYFRGSWSKGFRVPNLVQVNETIVSRQIFGVDALLCLQQINNNGEIDYCDYSFQRVARGSKNLRPEESTNISLGIIYEPKNIDNFVDTNLITTPHIGASTNEAQLKAGLDTVENIKKLLAGDSPTSHYDGKYDTDTTVLVYANTEWDHNEGGETLFYNEDKEVVQAIVPKPGRVAIFPANILHSARPPLPYVTKPRYTIAYKYEYGLIV